MRKLILTLTVVSLLFLLVSTIQARVLESGVIINFGKSYNGRNGGSMLSSSVHDYEVMINHAIRTSEGEVINSVYAHTVGYDLGYAVPKFGTMPHRLRVYFTFKVSNHASASIKVWYRREMGGGYVGHTMLFMEDGDLDGTPDRVIRRTAMSKDGRFYTGKNRYKTPVIDSSLPTDIQDWNYWFAFFNRMFKEEGADLE